jgi:prepilin-type N-terminal cleavage/methylation domain-containing protein
MKTAQNRKGFTLVEVIVTLAIAAIVVAAAVSFLMFGSNFLNRTETKAVDKTVAEKSADYIKERLLYASSVQVIRATAPPKAASGGDVLYIGNDTDGDGKADELSNTGRLYYMRADDAASGAIDVFAGVYKGNELAMSYAAAVTKATDGAITKRVFTLTASAIREGRQVYTSTKTFRLYDVGQSSDPIENLYAATWSNDSPSRGEKFYLLIGTRGTGYVQDGLVLHLDAIDNTSAGNAGGEPHHDAKAAVWSDLSGSGNDVQLTFTDNKTPIRDASIYFDGKGDYGVTARSLNLTGKKQITIEICFRPADAKGFATQTYTFSPADDSVGKPVSIDGSEKAALADDRLQAAVTVAEIPVAYEKDKLYIAGNQTGSWYSGEIASIRVYDRRLTEDEMKRNAAEDELRFG